MPCKKTPNEAVAENRKSFHWNCVAANRKVAEEGLAFRLWCDFSNWTIYREERKEKKNGWRLILA